LSTVKKVLVFAGSARAASYNKKLAAAAATLAAEAGLDVTLIDLADYPAAVYNGDDEDAGGVPESMRALKALMFDHDGLIIATPEYNGHVPPLLVNTFSWLSRKEGDEGSLAAFSEKKAVIMATSPGRLGGIRVLPRLRDTLAELGVMVIPGFCTLPHAGAAFDDTGALINEAAITSISGLIGRLKSELS